MRPTASDLLVLHKGDLHYSQAFKKLNEKKENNAFGVENKENSRLFKEIWRVHQKKINKVPRKPLSSLSNLQKKTFLDETDFEVLGFVNRQSRDLMFFRCFEEKALKIPEEFSKKTIAHTLDNDVTTDEEQVHSAIRNLKMALKETIDLKRKAALKNTSSNEPHRPKILTIR